MNLFEGSVLILLTLWFIGLGLSYIFRNPQGYLNWTGRTIRSIWRNAWQFIVGIVVGYFLATIH